MVVVATIALSDYPRIDFLSESWHTVGIVILGACVLPSFIMTLVNVVAYSEDGDDFKSSYVQFYLRYMYGMRFVPKWPSYIMFAWVPYFIQTNHLLLAAAAFIITLCGFTTVLIQNSLYNKYLMKEVKK